MRQLLCQSCAHDHGPAGTRRILEATEFEPAEWQRLVFGKAQKPIAEKHIMIVNEAVFPLDPAYFICDECNAQIRPGESCAAWSVWNELMNPPPPWEAEFLEAE